MVLSPTPYGLPFPKIGVRTPPKTPIAIISSTGKATNFNLARTITEVIRIKAGEKILKKRKRGRIQGLPNFLVTPYYLRNEKSYGFQIPLKMLAKRERGTAQFFSLQFSLAIFLSPEWEKLRLSNLASTFRGSIRTIAH